MIWLRHQPSTIIGLSHFLYWNVCNFHTSLCVVVACKLLNSLLKWVLVRKSILFYSQREWKTSWHFYRFINFNAYTLRWFDAFNAFNVQQWQRNEIQLMNALSNLMWLFAYAIKLLWCSDFYAMPTNLNFPILIGNTHSRCDLNMSHDHQFSNGVYSIEAIVDKILLFYCHSKYSDNEIALWIK